MTPQEIPVYQPSKNLLEDRAILVAGAAGGIGRSVSKSYAAHGARVILLDKEIKALESLYDEIETAGHRQPAIYPMNLEGATVKDYAELAATLEKEFERLDGLLINAGWVGGLTPLKLYDVERWLRVMTVNLHAPFLLTQACIPLLEKSSDPAIVFSTHDCARAYWGAYGVAKQGLEGLLKILAAELAGDKAIRVNGIDTGPVRTALRMENYPGEDPKSLPVPEDVAAPYLYFIGPDSAGVTGQNLRFG